MFSLEEVSQFKQIQTPFYMYDLRVLKHTLECLTEAAQKYNYHVHYALKANANTEILDFIQTYGLGADCVSGNEVKKALECGFQAHQIVFAGVGKSDEEIEFAIDNNIFCLNCESLEEILVINEIGSKKNQTVPIALRINPHVNAGTHHYITTGLEENKFGIHVAHLENIMTTLPSLKHIELTGLHFHVGSQIKDLNVFKSLCLKVNEIQKILFRYHLVVNHINVGGGLGVDYEDPDQHLIPDFQAFFQVFKDVLELEPHQQLHFELGRSIVAQCGTLICKVLYIKQGIKTQFMIVDAGMTELLRPALYQAVHKIENLSSQSMETERYDVVGPICESSDCFAKSLILPQTKRGDLMAIRTAGAYGESMASQYNLRTLVKDYYIYPA